MTVEIFTTLLASSIRMAVPYLLAGMGELFVQKSGVLNLSVEGLMGIGAFFGFIAAYYLGSIWMGIFIGIIAGLLFSLIFAVLAVSLGANQVISAIALNLLLGGAGLYLYRLIFGTPTVLPVAEETMGACKIGLLCQIPYLGKILFSQNPMAYVAFLLVPVLYILMNHTRFGLKVIACGEYPRAADTRGINVHLVRYLCIMLGGAMAGMAGAYLTIVQFNQYIPGLIAGRGFIAVVLVMFAKWSIKRVMFGALLFGFVEALALLFQTLVHFPHQFLLMLPYVVTILVLIPAYKQRSQMPAFLTVPYERD